MNILLKKPKGKFKNSQKQMATKIRQLKIWLPFYFPVQQLSGLYLSQSFTSLHFRPPGDTVKPVSNVLLPSKTISRCLSLQSTLFTFITQTHTLSLAMELKLLIVQSCPTLCDPVDCSPSGFSVYRILQARILESVVIPFSRGSSQPRDQTVVDSLPSVPPGSPGSQRVGYN